MYNYKEAMYNKAEIYYDAALKLRDIGVVNEALLIETQIATECYLCNVLEMIREEDCDKIFPHNQIPHNGSDIYKLIYPYGTTYHPALPRFSVELKNLLISAFKDYNSVRYPKEESTMKGARVVRFDDILDDFNLMCEVKEFTEQFRERYFELEAEKNAENERNK